VYALQALAAATAWPLGRSRPAHRAFAHYLAAYAALDVARAIREATHQHGPYVGAARLLFHLDQAAFLFGPIGLAYVAAQAFLGASAPSLGHILGASALLQTALVVTYPLTRGPTLDAIYAAVYGISQAAVWVSAGWWLLRHRGDWPDETQKVILALAAADLALWFTVFPAHVFDQWDLGNGFRAAILLWVCWHQTAWRRSMQA
jgi:hypothetical protein